MKAYFELREKLADEYRTHNQWWSAARDLRLDPTYMQLGGASIDAWTTILGSARTPERMDHLSAFIARESPHLSGLMAQYAAEVASGEHIVSDFPELRSIELSDGELEPARISASLNPSAILPPQLLAAALSPVSPPSAEQLDAALGGENTAAANAHLRKVRANLSQERITLETWEKNLKNQRDQIVSKIEAIERSRPPRHPIAPQAEYYGTEEQKLKAASVYSEELRRYDAALAKYKAEQAELPELRTRRDSVEQDLLELDSDIAEQHIRWQVAEREFLEDLAKARDRDLLLRFQRTLGSASAACHLEQNPFKGFWTLLGASCFLVLFKKAISQPSAAANADRAFAETAEALMDPIRNSINEIAKTSLAGPVAAYRALAANKEALARLTDQLENLPATQLHERCQAARKLLDEPVPTIPAFAHLEIPEEIDDMTRRLHALHADTASYIARLKVEIGGEPAELRHQVDEGWAGVFSTLDRMREVSVNYAEMLERSRMFWKVVSVANGSANLPKFARTLCEALPHEIVRRLNISVDDLIAEATNSEFGLKLAQAYVDQHLLTAYAADQEAMRRRLHDSESLLGQIDSAIEVIGSQFDRIAQAYRSRLTLAAVLSALPGIGAIASVWTAAVLHAMKPLVISDKPSYVRLGNFAVSTMAWATLASGVVAAVAVAVLATFLRDRLLDGSYGTFAAGLALACIVGLAFTFRNLLVVKWHLRERIAESRGGT